ncbi:MAG: response regulator [Candidatus Marinamargulisbacteria bacterium]
MNQRILIIDVDVSVHCRFIELLAKYPVEVYSLFCPKDAMLFLARTSVDVIFTELMLPNMNGLEFVRQIKTKPCLSRVNFLSSQSIELSLKEMDAYDIDHVFNKQTVSNKEILATVI